MISSDEHEYKAEDGCDDNEDDQANEKFAVLTVEEMGKRQNDDVRSVCSVLSVPREVAILILLHLHWNIQTLYEEWFANEEGISDAIGLLSGPVVVVPCELSGQNKSIVCNICFENFDFNQMSAVSCGHLFCNSCWDSYISIAINDGPGCLTLRCPDTSCSAAVGEDMMIKLVSIENQKKYNNYLIRSYVENNKNWKRKWCPAPDCNNAIEYISKSETFDVKCDCSGSFCWNCLGEIHRPVDCDTVAKWNYKNSKESNHTKWMFANSKPCPKCKKPIEKNNGCMHMTCIGPCYHQFCWLCLGPWKEHGGYACNKYAEGKEDGNFTEQEKRRQALKESIKRYTHFYQRWATNESSRRKSVKDLDELKRGKLHKLSDDIDFEVITKAWEQIIECRRVMKWSYVYGYYIPHEEKVKKQFFEFIQGEAEAALERLHHCAEEEEATQYADAHGPLHMKELKTLTQVTRNYFDHLVKALENGLEDVVSINETLGVVEQREEGLVGWECSKCTLFNSNLDCLVCQVCLHPRLHPQQGRTQRGKRGAGESSEIRKKVKFY